jgi:hypothetical protein
MRKRELVIAGFLIGFIAASALWIPVFVVSNRKSAIKAGVAEYTVDKTTGAVTFQYIAPCKTF